MINLCCHIQNIGYGNKLNERNAILLAKFVMETEHFKEKILKARSVKIEKMIACCDEAYEFAQKADNRELLGFLFFL